jgi:hypothetical protein
VASRTAATFANDQQNPFGGPPQQSAPPQQGGPNWNPPAHGGANGGMMGGNMPRDKFQGLTDDEVPF